jgi:hypothetical protein
MTPCPKVDFLNARPITGIIVRKATVKDVLNSVMRIWKSKASTKTLSGTRTMESPRDMAILSIHCSSLLTKNTKLQAKPGRNSMKMAPKTTRNTFSTTVTPSSPALRPARLRTQ